MKKLSAYTISFNCADIDDIIAGIKEIQLEILNCERLGEKVPDYYYIRFYKLHRKMDFLSRRNKLNK